MATRSRSQNSSLILVHAKHYGAAAKRKLTNTTPTPEPNDISKYKLILKSTKNLTPEVEQIANNLYLSQIEQSRILRTLSNTLTTMPIQDECDKFSIFLNNIGRVYQQTQEIYDIHLINTKDQFINPIHDFNTSHIEQCQSKKLQLKTSKAQYDISKQNDEKIKKLLDVRFPSDPDYNYKLKKKPNKRSKSVMDIKTDELAGNRKEFINSVIEMIGVRMQLMQTMQHFMSSFEAYSTMHSQNIQNYNKIMSDKLVIKYDWSKNAMVLKEGYFKKQGHRKYFKLFKNKKLLYMTGLGVNGTIKGYIDLNKIFDICKKGKDIIQIKTLSKTEMFHFDTMGDRNDWFQIMQQAVGSKKVSIEHAKKSFEEQIERDQMLGNDIV